MAGERGATLAQALVIVAVIGAVVGASLPSVSRSLRAARVRRATWDMASLFRLQRHLAVAESRVRGVVFSRDGDDWTHAVHHDGDGDGMRSADVRDGTDPRDDGPRRLSSRYVGVRPGFLPLPRIRRIPPSRGFLRPSDDPVRFGRADIVSFSPNGRASSGTLYLTDGHREQWAIVLFGVTGRQRVFRYDPESERWYR